MASTGNLTFSGSVGANKHVSVAIERHADGATQVTCGNGSAPMRVPATMPYVIGPNGLGQIRGPNSLDSLRRVFGEPSALRRGDRCVTTWREIGLRIELRSGSCAGSSVLRSATVSGHS